MSTLADALGKAGIEPAPTNCPKDGKRCFATEAEALRFAEWANKKFEGQPEQHPYQCPHCPSWHLTSQVTGSPKIAKVAYAPKTAGARAEVGVTRELVKGLWLQKFSREEIAKKLNLTSAGAYYHLHRLDIDGEITYARKKRKRGKAAPVLVTVEGIDAEIEKLKAERARIVEAQSLKIMRCTDGRIYFSKDGEHAAFTPADCQILIQKLSTLLEAK
jgi:hypothetical protein